MWRLVLLLVLGYHGTAAAAVSCEQLGGMAEAAVQLRNQGDTLQTVLGEADKLEASGKFTADELARIRSVVRAAYLGDRTPVEVLQECKQKLPR